MTSPVAATVDSAGITAPTFAQIFAYLVSQYQAIFGADAYLGNDSQDGQFIGIVAQAIADCNAGAVAVYNSFSPATAQGNGLSSNVKINGLTRLLGSFSTVTLTCVGVAGTQIQNGQAADGNGNLWNLPALVTIPIAGTIDVLATCALIGAVTASANSITTIQTPVFGWQSVNNSAAATPGAAVETDAALRVRQSVSTAAPAQNVFDGIVASIAAVLGVTRVAGYENNTNSTDGNGVPAGNLAFVVEGGVASTIAQAIAAKIPPGVPTFATGAGAQSIAVTDGSGYTKTINFMNKAAGVTDTINVNLTVHGLTGWSTSTEAVITAAVQAYLNALPIGQSVSFFGVSTAAQLIDTPYAGTFRITAMTMNKNGGGNVSADIAVAFNEFPVGGTVNFTVV